MDTTRGGLSTKNSDISSGEPSVNEVDPHNGFLMKPLDDSDRMDHSSIPDLNLHVIGPHCI